MNSNSFRYKVANKLFIYEYKYYVYINMIWH